MKTNLYFLQGFNNYYDRRVKKYEYATEYVNESITTYVLNDTNFNPNDGISASHTVGAINVPLNFSPDYMVEVNNNGLVTSRWFVVELSRVREGQHTITLRRDVVADFWETAKLTDSFIEKATVGFDDPAIYNAENMTFNRIKRGEVLLKDKSNCPWLVAYIDKDYSVTDQNVSAPAIADIAAIQIPSSLENWEYYNYTSEAQNPQYINSSIESCEYCITVQTINSNRVRTYFTDYNGGGTTVSASATGSSTGIRDEGYLSTVVQTAYENYGFTVLNSLLETQILHLDRNLINYVGKYLQFGENGPIYYASAVNNYARSETINVDSNNILRSPMYTIGSNVGFSSYQPNSRAFKVNVTVNQINLLLISVPAIQVSYSIEANRVKTTDAPYDIVAIPFGSINLIDADTNNSVLYKSDKDTAYRIINAISVNGATNVYDIQLLPYCPIPSAIDAEGTFRVPTNGYSLVGTNDYKATAIFYVPSCRFGGTVELETPVVITEPKIQCLCDSYRLCSPNYASVFEINAAMNGGLRVFEFDCEYKPFSPYIHINPIWGGLYGGNYNDARGLVCGGDFSLAQITDQWKQYEVNNKNYQLMFDRQINNLEVQHGWQMGEAIVGVFGGGITGAGTGAAIGATSGGGMYGAIAGGIVGGVMGTGAAIADVVKTKQLYNETLDYTKDMFGYNLGNIKALPNTLTKISAFNPNNKLFPVLEYYTCTDVEKQALRDKVKYNGMTVMRIGKINDFVKEETTYIKAKPILLTNLHDDFHVAAELASELNMGIRVNGGLT